MLKTLFNFYKTSPDSAPLTDKDQIKKMYRRARLSVMLSVTLGYGLFYVCRLSLSVAKKPIMESGFLDASQLGKMGSAMYITYAIGKFLNGFIADHVNIKKFMSTGLLVSACANLLLGFTDIFYLFIILWGINGWFQSWGAAPSVVSISQWFSNREMGTYYGIWSASHNIGAAFTFVGTAFVVTYLGWRWGFMASGLICIVGTLLLYMFLYDRPKTLGLPPIADFNNDHCKGSQSTEKTWELQKQVVKNPAVWILGLSSALFYIARYAIESWGIVYLGAQKGYTTIEAGYIVSISSIAGIPGTICSGYISDRFFKSRRNLLSLILGIIYAASLILFLFTPAGHPFIDAASMAVFGFCLGALLVYLGGLMAVDICAKRSAGAAMGMIGLFSYLATGISEIFNGYLINSYKTVIGETITYNFLPVSIFWITAAILSFLTALLVWNVKHEE